MDTAKAAELLAEALAVLAEAIGPFEKLGEGTHTPARADALVALGTAYARASDKRLAAEYFDRAIRLAAENRYFDEGHKLRALIEVGARYAEVGIEPDAQARESLRRLIRGVEAERE